MRWGYICTPREVVIYQSISHLINNTHIPLYLYETSNILTGGFAVIETVLFGN